MMGGLLFFFEQAVVSVSLFLLGVYFMLSGVFLGGFEYAISNLEVGANSVVMVLLVSIVILGVMVCGAEGLWGAYFGGVVVLVMGLIMGLFFMVDSWVGFYVAYEGVVFPLVLCVLVWGVYYERVSSCLYLVVYTVLFSTPLLLLVLWGVSSGYIMWVYWWGLPVSGLWGGWLFITLLAMLVKVPMYGLHGWLPKVHVEAPTWGSILLAGVVIKLGVYGMYVLVVSGVGGAYMWLVGLWALMGGIVSGMYCLVVGDTKSLVAYSSVVHMAVTIWLLLSMGSGVWRGVVLIAVMHGLVSAASFGFIGGLGEGLKSRSVVVLKGVVSMYSFSGLLLAVVLVFNMGFPVSGGMLGEIEAFNSVFNLLGVGWAVVLGYMMLSCMFSLYLGVNLAGLMGSRSFVLSYKVYMLEVGLLLLSVLYLGGSDVML
uniref:NADH-ubiquinone oxidoreductase chain 4 n=1 Tax=Pomphorhynchus tereticollis TaxID=255491 RepID=A0A806GWZ1_9BILA|nr:NADH dehydrogenase subunit 4 [Pomphorhynchus tereticollis]